MKSSEKNILKLKLTIEKLERDHKKAGEAIAELKRELEEFIRGKKCND